MLKMLLLFSLKGFNVICERAHRDLDVLLSGMSLSLYLDVLVQCFIWTPEWIVSFLQKECSGLRHVATDDMDDLSELSHVLWLLVLLGEDLRELCRSLLHEGRVEFLKSLCQLPHFVLRNLNDRSTVVGCLQPR